MKYIPLTQSQFAIVDDDDFEELNKFKWHAVYWGNTFYAERTIRINGKKLNLLMHRELLCLKKHDGVIIDHRDRNGLNNQRNNLRIVTKSINQYNRKIQSNNTSGYRGVCWHSQAGKWRAYIFIKGKQISLGLYSSSVSAAIAYDKSAVKYYKNDAILNLPIRSSL
jgi:hypothetical protein